MADKKEFGRRLRKLRKSLDLSQVDAANAIGIGYSSLQLHEGGRFPSLKTIKKYVDFYKCNEEWLLEGKGDKEPVQKQDEHPKAPVQNSIQNFSSNVIDLQHSELVKNFKDKERAKAINAALLELESLSPEAFEEIESYIKGMVRGIQLATGNSKTSSGDRRYHQRRTHNDHDAIPEEGDRRSGKNRRAANGN